MLSDKTGTSHVSKGRKNILQKNAAKARAVKESKIRLNSTQPVVENTQKRSKSDNVVNFGWNGSDPEMFVNPPDLSDLSPHENVELGGVSPSDDEEIMPQTHEGEFEKSPDIEPIEGDGEIPIDLPDDSLNSRLNSSRTEQFRESIKNMDYDGIKMCWNLLQESFPQVSNDIDSISIFSRVWNLDLSSSKIMKNGDRYEKYRVGVVGGKNMFIQIYVPKCLEDTNFSYSWVKELVFTELFHVAERNRSGLCSLPRNCEQVGHYIRFGIQPDEFNEWMNLVSQTWMKFFNTDLKAIQFDFRMFVRKLKILMTDERMDFLDKVRKCPDSDVLDSDVKVDPRSLISFSIEEFAQKSANIANLSCFLSLWNTESCDTFLVDIGMMSKPGFLLLSSPLNLKGVCKDDICIPFCNIAKKNELKQEFRSLDPLLDGDDIDSPTYYGIPLNVWSDTKSLPIPKEGGSGKTSVLGIVKKFNFYCTNKNNLEGNGLQPPFSRMLDGLSRFVKQFTSKNTNLVDTFDNKVTLFEHGVVGLVNSLNMGAGRYRMEFSVAFSGRIDLNDLFEVGNYLHSNWYIPCERLLTDTSNLYLPYVEDIYNEMKWMITEIERINENFIESNGNLADLALMNHILKICYLFYSDNPKWMLVIQKLARTTNLEGDDRKKALISDLKSSIVYLNQKEFEFCDQISLKEGSGEEIARYIHHQLIKWWMVALKRKYADVEMSGDNIVNWKVLKEKDLGGYELSDYGTVDFDEYFQLLLAHHRGYRFLQIDFVDLRPFLVRIMDLNRLHVVYRLTKKSNGYCFSYAKALILTRADRIMPRILPKKEELEKNKAALILFNTLLFNWGLVGTNPNITKPRRKKDPEQDVIIKQQLEERMKEFTQGHHVEQVVRLSIKNPKKWNWWCENHFKKWIKQDHIEKTVFGKIWSSQSTESQDEILEVMKDMFLIKNFTFVQVVHHKYGKYFWRTDKKQGVMWKGQPVKNDDGSDRTTSLSLMAIDLTDDDDASSMILEDESNFCREEDHINECNENMYVSGSSGEFDTISDDIFENDEVEDEEDEIEEDFPDEEDSEQDSEESGIN